MRQPSIKLNSINIINLVLIQFFISFFFKETALAVEIKCSSIFVKKEKINTYYGTDLQLSSDHHPLIEDLQNSIIDPMAIVHLLNQNQIQVPEITKIGKNHTGLLRAIRKYDMDGNSNYFYHGTNLASALRIKEHGLNFFPGEGGIISGFFVTNELKISEFWANQVANERTERNGISSLSQSQRSKQRLINFNKDPNEFIPAVMQFNLNPNSKIIHLSKLTDQKKINGEIPAYHWYLEILKTKQAPSILSSVLKPDFFKKYFNLDGSLKKSGLELYTKQSFATLFAVDGLLIDVPGEHNSYTDLALTSKTAIINTKIIYDSSLITTKQTQFIQNADTAERWLASGFTYESTVEGPFDSKYIIDRFFPDSNLVVLKSLGGGQIINFSMDKLLDLNFPKE